jgi:hydroxymethylglutaryl-CoA reductase (NADPH)
VRNSDFLVLDDDLPTSYYARHPSIAYTPTSGLWAPFPVTSPPNASVEVWMRQLVLEVPRGMALQLKEEVREAASSATAKALEGVACYEIEGVCWSVQTQPTLNLTARSFAFTSSNASKEFSNNIAAADLSTSHLELLRIPNSQGRRYTSFFNRKPLVDGTDDIVFQAARARSQEEMQSVKWMIYAGRAFILRFWGLAKVSTIVREFRNGIDDVRSS